MDTAARASDASDRAVTAANRARDDLVALQQRGVTWTLGGGRPMLPATDAATTRCRARAVRRARRRRLRGHRHRFRRDLDVLLLRRAATLGSHPGQIAFPGGRLEGDEDATTAALREAVEETGLDPSGVEVLGTLPDAPLMVSDHLVTPVLAWWTKPSQVAAVDPAETVDVFRVPVAELLDPEHRMTAVVARGGREFRAPGVPSGRGARLGLHGHPALQPVRRAGLGAGVGRQPATIEP